MTCPDCGTPVEYSGRGVLVDREGTGMRKHFCGPPPLEIEQWDICTCGAQYVRVNRGELLNADHTRHVCPARTAPVRAAVQAQPSKLRIL